MLSGSCRLTGFWWRRRRCRLCYVARLLTISRVCRVVSVSKKICCATTLRTVQVLLHVYTRANICAEVEGENCLWYMSGDCKEPAHSQSSTDRVFLYTTFGAYSLCVLQIQTYDGICEGIILDNLYEKQRAAVCEPVINTLRIKNENQSIIKRDTQQPIPSPCIEKTRSA